MHPTDASAAPSLEEFAPQSVTTCTVCSLPAALREEIHGARGRDPKRFTYPVIATWLGKAHAVEVSDSSLRRHFSRAHHVQDGR